MKTKALTAAQIDTLAQHLSQTPIKPATSAGKANDNLARLLTAPIAKRSPHDRRHRRTGTVILPAPAVDQASHRKYLVSKISSILASAGVRRCRCRR
jgi:hypothetical protein